MGRRKQQWSIYAMPALRSALSAGFTADRDRYADVLADADITIEEAEDDDIFAALDSRYDAEQQIADSRDSLRDVDAAELFWVTKRMVRFTAAAAQSLPDWTPTEAAPSLNGLVAFAEPAGSIPSTEWDETPLVGETVVQVPWDGMVWSVDDLTGNLRVATLTRQPSASGGNPAWDGAPLTPVHIYHFDADALTSTADKRTQREDGGILSFIGAMWLIMSQPSTAQVAHETAPIPHRKNDDPPVPGPPPRRQTADVSIIDVHPQQQEPSERETGGSNNSRSRRQYRHRWWVRGHWKQQAYGPHRSLRKPMYISAFVKGPEDKPFMKGRVYVLRDGEAP